MAAQQSSRTALISWVVALTVVAVTALIFAFVQFAAVNKLTKDLEDTRKRYDDVILTAQLTGPEVAQLREARQTEGSGFGANDKLFNVAIGQRDALVKILTGTTSAPNAAVAQTAATLAKVTEQVKAAGVSVDANSATNLNGLLSTLAATIESQNNEIARLAGAVKSAKANEAATIKRTTEQLAAKDAQITSARTDGNNAISLANDDRGGKQKVIDAINAQVEGERRTFADREQELSSQIAAKERQIAQLDKDLRSVRLRLGDLRINPAGPVVRTADATVVRVSGDDTVYINLGAGEQMVRGLTFEIFDKIDGIPAITTTDPTSQDNLPRGKASIEIVRVGPTTSEARIIRREKGSGPIVEGDLVSNVVFDKSTKFRFLVFGKFDLDRNGIATASDAEVVRRLVSEWGGELTNEVNVDTDFVVLGATPELPNFTREEAQDPINAKRLADAQAELEAYNAILTKARDLSIPIMNQNRFLFYTGFYEQSSK
jgi:hypothetical protein